MSASRVGVTAGLCDLITGMTSGAGCATFGPNLPIELEKLYVYSLIWSVGGLLEFEDRWNRLPLVVSHVWWHFVLHFTHSSIWQCWKDRRRPLYCAWVAFWMCHLFFYSFLHQILLPWKEFYLLDLFFSIPVFVVRVIWCLGFCLKSLGFCVNCSMQLFTVGSVFVCWTRVLING